ncbi:MAG: response regulator transcription factor [Acidimicrobiaceae bacterium]|nr:response regulator transcription factor [Acidimicrobiaceae bacterium]
MHATVLVVEDELKLRDLLRAYFEREGMTVLTAATGADAITLGLHGNPEVVVLDLGLPDIPGEHVAAELRRRGDPLIIILSARALDEDRVRGLELGADDYLTKPFNPRELVLRVQALLRRGRAAPSSEVRSFGGGRLVIDEGRHEARVKEKAVNLSPSEWGVLVTLARVPGRVYSRYELVNAVRGYEWEGYERVIDTHVKNLRRKLQADDPAAATHVIETVVGVGYRLGLGRDREVQH